MFCAPSGLLNHSVRRGATVLLALALVGCNALPSGRFQAFSAASEEISARTTDTYARIEKWQRDFVVLSAPDKPLSTDTFRPVVQGVSFDIRPELQYREATLNVLVMYAKALESLVGKDYATDIDKSAQDLAASVRGLRSDGENAAASNAFGAVADLLGTELTNWMRKRALEKAMDLGQPGVDTLTGLLRQSNVKIVRFTDEMRDRYIAHAQAARPAFGTWERYRFDVKVADALAEFGEIGQALQSANSALEQLPGAHREIRVSLESREHPLDALHQTIQEAQRLRGFYKSLPTH